MPVYDKCMSNCEQCLKRSNAIWNVMEWSFMFFHLLPLAYHELPIMCMPVVVVYVPRNDVAKLASGTELHEDEFKDRRSIS